MVKTVTELEEELEAIREGLLIALQSPHSLEILDIRFIAQQVSDIKQEMRIARASDQ